MNTRLCGALSALAFVLGGCAGLEKEHLPVTPPEVAKVSPVAREPLPKSPAPPLQEDWPTSALPLPPVPPRTLYVCAKLVQGKIEQTAIEFISKVEAICRRHPEMGPCQYERDFCRRSGGRVFTPNGTEITLQTEAEYDKKVYRVRFRAD